MRSLILAASLLVAAPAAAEVKSSSPNGFVIEQQVRTVVPAPTLFAAFGRVQGWWDPEHTYSGEAANMSLALSPGGCFCERLKDGGGIEHMRVAYVEPGKQVVMTGALGPLLYEAVSGVMTAKVEPIAGGSRLILTYRAAGFADGGAQRLAPLVDQVLGVQMKRLRTFAAQGSRSGE